MTDELQAAIDCLPELYQPILGYAADSKLPRRACADRLDAIVEALSAFELDPTVVVDVGAAQGYFTLALAERFPRHRFVGLDSLEENVRVSNVLNELRQTNARFQLCQARAGTLGPMLTGQRNCVLLLNVLHHVCTQQGWIETDRMLKEIAENADLSIVELASATERLEWTRDLPSDDSTWLEHFRFVRSLGTFGTHIPGVARTMYLCSSRWVLAGHDKFEFSRAIDRSHDDALPSPETGRRYFLSPSMVAKCFAFSGKLGRRNIVELNRELRFLRFPPEGFAVPELLGVSLKSGSGVVARTRWEGEILSAVLARPAAENDARRIVSSICGDLCTLEASGLFHHDLRPWNTIVTADESIRLIDYGSISSRRTRDVFEDVVEFACWLISPRERLEPWGTKRYRLPSGNRPGWLESLASTIDSTDTRSLSFRSLREVLERSSTRPPSPASPGSEARSPDAWHYLAGRLTRALYGIGRLTDSAKEAEAYARSLARELSALRDDARLQIGALSGELDRVRNDAKRQITALARRAERSESHGRSLADNLRRTQEDLSRMSEDARLQIGALAGRANTAEVYAGSLVEEVDRLRNDAQDQIQAHAQRAQTSESYARSLADELDRTRLGLDETVQELNDIKSTLVVRATKWLRKS